MKNKIILDHSDHGGPKGLYSLTGVKFTTSHVVAEKTIKKIFSGREKANKSFNDLLSGKRNIKGNQRGIFNQEDFKFDKIEELKTQLFSIIEEESPRNFEDLIFRRTNLWKNSLFSIRTTTSR